MNNGIVKIFSAFGIAGSLAGLVACGDDVTQINQTGLDMVSSVEDLPKCTSSNEGEQIIVKDDGTIRYCSDGKWYATMGSAGAGAADTIFVSKKDTVFMTGHDTVFVGGSFGEKNEAILDSEQVAVSLDSVKGTSQKGPFLSGSKVQVKELRDGRSLTQTGNNFDGKILNDKGEFRITARMLVSQYVMLEASGYYRNEVTGENSNSPLTLFGITDVTGRDIVNINLLTHLEYERVYYLVTKEGYTVKKAKKKAQQEIFDILHIDNTNFSNSEDLSIAGSSDEDGALLAFSILFQGDRSVSQLTELLTRISTAMEKEGKWEDASAKAEIADWAMAADTSNRLADIRGKVDAWKLGSLVPKFEPYVRNFWRVEHGLGSCGDTVKVGTVVKPTRGKTEANIRFICAEKSASGIAFANGESRWRVATDFEKDTYGWKDSTDGALKNGAVTDKKYVYDATGAKNGTKGWREAVGPENQYGGCNESLYDSIRTYRGKTEAGFYQCQEKSHQWVRVRNSLTVDTQLWKPDEDGYAKWGDSVGVISQVGSDITWKRVCYVYDTSTTYKGYRVGNDLDCNLDLGGCTKGIEKLGIMQFAEKTGNYYMCKSNKWNLVSDDVQKNTYKLTCNADNDGSVIPGTADTWYYVCDANQWRKASQAEYEACYLDGVCNACTDSRQGVFINDDELVCDNKAWRTPDVAELARKSLCVDSLNGVILYDVETVSAITVDYICSDDSWRMTTPIDYTLEQWNARLEKYKPDVIYGTLTDSRDGRTYKTVTIGEQVWMAENLQYADSVMTLNLKGNSWCYNNEPKNCEILGRLYTWTAAMNINKTYQSARVPTGMIQNPHRGICPEGWHIPSEKEWYTFEWDIFESKMEDSALLLAIGNPSWPNATNTSGFTALPAGYYDGRFRNVGSDAYFWGVWKYENGVQLVFWQMNASPTDLSSAAYAYYGYSVRCLQDQN